MTLKEIYNKYDCSPSRFAEERLLFSDENSPEIESVSGVANHSFQESIRDHPYTPSSTLQLKNKLESIRKKTKQNEMHMADHDAGHQSLLRLAKNTLLLAREEGEDPEEIDDEKGAHPLLKGIFSLDLTEKCIRTAQLNQTKEINSQELDKLLSTAEALASEARLDKIYEKGNELRDKRKEMAALNAAAIEQTKVMTHRIDEEQEHHLIVKGEQKLLQQQMNAVFNELKEKQLKVTLLEERKAMISDQVDNLYEEAGQNKKKLAAFAHNAAIMEVEETAIQTDFKEVKIAFKLFQEKITAIETNQMEMDEKIFMLHEAVIHEAPFDFKLFSWTILTESTIQLHRFVRDNLTYVASEALTTLSAVAFKALSYLKETVFPSLKRNWNAVIQQGKHLLWMALAALTAYQLRKKIASHPAISFSISMIAIYAYFRFNQHPYV